VLLIILISIITYVVASTHIRCLQAFYKHLPLHW